MPSKSKMTSLYFTLKSLSGLEAFLYKPIPGFFVIVKEGGVFGPGKALKPGIPDPLKSRNTQDSHLADGVVGPAGAVPEEVNDLGQHVGLVEAHKEIAGMPQNSVLILTDARNVVDNKENSIAMKEFSTRISPYVKAYALVGAHGLRAVLLQAAATLTKRSARPFDNRNEAIDWLAEIR